MIQSLIKLGVTLGIASSCWMFAVPLPAAEDTFSLYRTAFQIPERGQVHGYAVVTSRLKLSFLPPVGWTAEMNRSKREVLLGCGEFGTVVSFRLVEGTDLGLRSESRPDAAPVPQDDAARKEAEARKERARGYVKEHFTNAKIITESECFADGNQGIAFDLDRDGSGTSMRVALVQGAAGLVEFQLSAPPAKMDSARFAMACVMSSFRTVPLDDQQSSDSPANAPSKAADLGSKGNR